MYSCPSNRKCDPFLDRCLNNIFNILACNVLIIILYLFFSNILTPLFNSAPELFEAFEKLKSGSNEEGEFEKAWDVLKTVKNASGEVTKDADLESLIKAAVGEEKKMDFGKFMNLFSRIKQSRSWFTTEEKKMCLHIKKKDYILNYFYKKQLHVVMIICFWTRNAS